MHDDHKPSGSIYEKDGKWHYGCFPCGFSGDRHNLKDKYLGLPAGTSYAKENGKACSKKPVQKQRIYSRDEISQGAEAVYEYWDIDGKNILMIEVKYGKAKQKPFCSYQRNGSGWTRGFPSPIPLYCGSANHAKRIKCCNEIVIVNGCKTVRALHQVGIVATCRAGGEQSPEKVDWAPIYGKEAVLWPDNDPAGYQYMNAVKDLLLPHCKVSIVKPKEYNLPEKGDAYEWVEMCRRKDGTIDTDVVRMPIDNAVACGVSGDINKYIEDVIEGTLYPVKWPWKQLTYIGQCLTPGSTTLFCGGGGSGKSMFMINAISYWHDLGVKWCMLALESPMKSHILRALSMRVKDSHITEMAWMHNNPEIIRTYFNDNKDWIDSFGSHLTILNTKKTQTEVGDWIYQQAKAGQRVIIIDPISIATPDMGKNIWESDEHFVDLLEKLATKYNISIITVIHPTKDDGGPLLRNIKGGTAWPNFTHNVLWLEPMQDKLIKCQTDPCAGVLGKEDCMINRKLYMLKNRGGKQWEAVLGYMFDGNTLTFEEKGVVVK